MSIYNFVKTDLPKILLLEDEKEIREKLQKKLQEFRAMNYYTMLGTTKENFYSNKRQVADNYEEIKKTLSPKTHTQTAYGTTPQSYWAELEEIYHLHETAYKTLFNGQSEKLYHKNPMAPNNIISKQGSRTTINIQNQVVSGNIIISGAGNFVNGQPVSVNTTNINNSVTSLYSRRVVFSSHAAPVSTASPYQFNKFDFASTTKIVQKDINNKSGKVYLFSGIDNNIKVHNQGNSAKFYLHGDIGNKANIVNTKRATLHIYDDISGNDIIIDNTKNATIHFHGQFTGKNISINNKKGVIHFHNGLQKEVSLTNDMNGHVTIHKGDVNKKTAKDNIKNISGTVILPGNEKILASQKKQHSRTTINFTSSNNGNNYNIAYSSSDKVQFYSGKNVTFYNNGDDTKSKPYSTVVVGSGDVTVINKNKRSGSSYRKRYKKSSHASKHPKNIHSSWNKKYKHSFTVKEKVSSEFSSIIKGATLNCNGNIIHIENKVNAFTPTTTTNKYYSDFDSDSDSDSDSDFDFDTPTTTTTTTTHNYYNSGNAATQNSQNEHNSLLNTNTTPQTPTAILEKTSGSDSSDTDSSKQPLQEDTTGQIKSFNPVVNYPKSNSNPYGADKHGESSIQNNGEKNENTPLIPDSESGNKKTINYSAENSFYPNRVNNRSEYNNNRSEYNNNRSEQHSSENDQSTLRNRLHTRITNLEKELETCWIHHDRKKAKIEALKSLRTFASYDNLTIGEIKTKMNEPLVTKGFFSRRTKNLLNELKGELENTQNLKSGGP